MDVDKVAELIKRTMLSDLSRLSLEDTTKYIRLTEAYLEVFKPLESLKEIRLEFFEEMFSEVSDRIPDTEWIEPRSKVSVKEVKEEVSIAKAVKEAMAEAYSSDEKTIEVGIDLDTAITVSEDSKEHGSIEIIPAVVDSASAPAIEKVSYVFERLLRGGTLKGLECFIPESRVRELSLSEGDKVSATRINTGSDEEIRYFYELVEKCSTKGQGKRIQYNLCPVEKDGSLLVVTKSMETGKNIKKDEMPLKLVLHSKDVAFYSISEGDLIDVAFMKDREEFPRVIYKHVIDATQVTPRKTKKENKRDFRPSVKIVSETLLGRKILIVGNEAEKSRYKEEVESRSGEVEWYSVDTSKTRLESAVLRADLVVCTKNFTSHDTANFLRSFCKKNSIPFRNTAVDRPASLGRFIETTCRQIFFTTDVKEG